MQRLYVAAQNSAVSAGCGPGCQTFSSDVTDSIFAIEPTSIALSTTAEQLGCWWGVCCYYIRVLGNRLTEIRFLETDRRDARTWMPAGAIDVVRSPIHPKAS